MPGICCEPVVCPECGAATTVYTADAAGCIVSCSCLNATQDSSEACGPNMHYNDCGTACPLTCDPAPMACVAMCRAGCQCNDGYVLHNDTCIPAGDCPQASNATTAAPVTEKMAGGSLTVDVSSTLFAEAMQCVLASISAENNEPTVLHHVVSGTQQVVSGVLYTVTVAVVPAACNGDCPIQEFSTAVQMQPWLTPSCTIVNLVQLSGAVSVTSLAAMSAAQCAVTDLNARSNSLYQLEVVSVASASVNATAMTVHVTVGLSQCQNNGVQLNASVCPVNVATLVSYAVAVEESPTCTVLSSAMEPLLAAPPGGVVALDLTSSATLSAAACAVAQLNAQSNSVYQLQLVSVLAGTRQVVAGMRYNLTIAVALSASCLNDGVVRTLASCPATSSSQQYQAIILVQPWHSPSCTVASLVASTALLGTAPGGASTADVTSAGVVDAAACAVRELNTQSNSVKQLVLVQIVSATRQVVAGAKYTVTMRVGLAQTCLNTGVAQNVSLCPVDAATVSLYQAVVLVQPWVQAGCGTVLSVGLQAASTASSSAETESLHGPALIGVFVAAAGVMAVAVTVFLVRKRLAARATVPEGYAPAAPLLNEDADAI